MSERIGDLLDDLATDAGGYGDPDRAVATARRRGAVRRVVVPVLAAAAVAILAAVLASPGAYHRVERGPEIGTTPDEPGEYPDRVTVPERDVPLPEAPLARYAAFIYAPCSSICVPYLVMQDGTQYRLPRPGSGPPTYGYTLSPDGRWLGSPTPSGFRLRDLRSGEARAIPDSGPGVTNAWVWSPDSFWLLLARHIDGNVDHYLLMNLYDGSEPIRIAPPPATVVAMRNTGDLVCWIAGGDEPGRLPVLGLVPRGQSTVSEELPVRLPPGASGGLLRDGEAFKSLALYLGPTGNAGVLVVHDPPVDGDRWVAGVVGIELSGGGYVSGRTDLPKTTPPGPGDFDVWKVAGNLSGGVVLLHVRRDRTEIVILNDVNGEREVVSVLPGSIVTVRGEARY